ncbi:hypothetical protein DERP_004969 [Dermatophagoides pteronyssinus]|uniref:Uncharacterized protein n=1 Tax=Dermatophagoides pteronyssinus TaxID=6956 RepID=A0ABQ8JT15_DERPT|nr:hypothetical protein DERP_004969 [Dermatophagoides pteronyssinus]
MNLNESCILDNFFGISDDYFVKSYDVGINVSFGIISFKYDNHNVLVMFILHFHFVGWLVVGPTEMQSNRYIICICRETSDENCNENLPDPKQKTNNTAIRDLFYI